MTLERPIVEHTISWARGQRDVVVNFREYVGDNALRKTKRKKKRSYALAEARVADYD